MHCIDDDVDGGEDNDDDDDDIEDDLGDDNGDYDFDNDMAIKKFKFSNKYLQEDFINAQVSCVNLPIRSLIDIRFLSVFLLVRSNGYLQPNCHLTVGN